MKEVIDWEYESKQIANIVTKTSNKEIKMMIDEGVKYNILNANEMCIGQLYDLCGFAFVKFIKRNNSVYRSYKKYIETKLKENCDTNTFTLMPSTRRQELRVNKAVANAVCDYLNNKFGRLFYVNSFVD